mmetsp:Transcript_44212/g.96175  ORF Transcript_44212/g.96175 Transcript_44212/m.96175 type:complete len:597 (+) Transcript_44212:173-1963(+)
MRAWLWLFATAAAVGLRRVRREEPSTTGAPVGPSCKTNQDCREKVGGGLDFCVGEVCSAKSCFEHGVTYGGEKAGQTWYGWDSNWDLGHSAWKDGFYTGAINSSATCQDLCRKNPDCKYFSYNTAPGVRRCHMSTKRTPATDPQNIMISGPVNCECRTNSDCGRLFKKFCVAGECRNTLEGAEFLRGPEGEVVRNSTFLKQYNYSTAELDWLKLKKEQPGKPKVNCTGGAEYYDWKLDQCMIHCPDIGPNLRLPKEYANSGGDDDVPWAGYGAPPFRHGKVRPITCAADHAPTSKDYPISSWGQSWYKGKKETNFTCNNGTWYHYQSLDMMWVKPKELTCASLDQIRGLRKMMWTAKYVGNELKKANDAGFQFIDGEAGGRKAWIEHSLSFADKFVEDAKNDNWPTAEAINTVTEHLVDNRIFPRGKPFGFDTCSSLEKHNLFQLKPREGTPGMFPTANDYHLKPNLEPAAEFSCRYSMDKRLQGFDPITGAPIFFYRQGCVCDSRYIMGCPFKNYPFYLYLGFASVEEKVISKSLGTPQPNSICWYWSDALHPEWGYLGDENKEDLRYFQAPLVNSSALFTKQLEEEEKKGFEDL